MWTCPKCGQENGELISFCMTCVYHRTSGESVAQKNTESLAASDLPGESPEHSFPGSASAGVDDTKPCPTCGETVKAMATLCRFCKSDIRARALDPSSEVLGRDLWMEAHLQAISLWCRAIGVTGGIMWPFIINMEAGIGTLILLVPPVVLFTLGHFLRKYSNKARIITGVLAALAIIIEMPVYAATRKTMWIMPPEAPIVLTIALLWALFNHRASKICTYEYRQLASFTSYVKPPVFKSLLFLIPAAILIWVCCGFASVIFSAMTR